MSETDKKYDKVDYKALAYKNHNKGKIVTLVLIVAGYIFFFMSPNIFNELPAMQHTEKGQMKAFGNKLISVESWSYSPSQKMMEVCCYIDNSSSKKTLEYGFSAQVNFENRRKSVENLLCEIVYQESDYIVLMIYGVPENFYCAAVNLSYNNDNIQITDSNNAFEATEETVEHSGDYGTVSLFTAKQKTTAVDEIVPKTNTEFKIMRIEFSIDKAENLIEDYNEKITEYENANEELRENIYDLQYQMNYQIKSEQIETQNEIESYQSKITSNNSLISKLKLDITEQEGIITEYEELIENLKKK